MACAVALLALALASTAAPWLQPSIAVLDAALVVAAVVDRLRTPAPGALALERSVPERVGLSQDFVRVVRVEPGDAAGLVLEVVERASPCLDVVARAEDGASVAPPAADPSGGADRGILRAGAPLVLERTYRATRRGVERLGDLRLRLRGPLGLVLRQARVRADQAIVVEPPLLGLSNTLRLAASERWHDLGVRRLRRRGGLTEFESLRDYVHGDDVRLVDWKAFARRGRPIVREYQEERGQELVLVVDRGRRMAATTAEGDERGWTKLDHALDTALQLAAVALQEGDRVGLATFDARLHSFVAPARGARQLARLRESVFDLAPSRAESDLENALRELAVRHRRHAMLVVLADVPDLLSAPRTRRALGAGARHHRIVVAGLDDPALRRAAEGASGEPPSVRAAALELGREREEALAELARSGVRVLDALPAEAAAPLLAAWLDARRSGRG